MTNLDVQNNIYTFSINGGDLKTTKVALYGPIMCIILPPLIYWYGLTPYLFPNILPPFLDTWLLLISIVLGFLVAFFLLQRLNQGNFTRFEVVINRNNEKISAYDRERDQHLWEEDFHPKYLYTTTINVVISDESFSFPTLVYAEERLPQVEEGVPYPELSVLGYGEETSITKILHELKGDESSIDM
jgi:hypothetical protein